jgi:hypothetical protein
VQPIVVLPRGLEYRRIDAPLCEHLVVSRALLEQRLNVNDLAEGRRLGAVRHRLQHDRLDAAVALRVTGETHDRHAADELAPVRGRVLLFRLVGERRRHGHAPTRGCLQHQEGNSGHDGAALHGSAGMILARIHRRQIRAAAFGVESLSP